MEARERVLQGHGDASGRSGDDYQESPPTGSQKDVYTHTLEQLREFLREGMEDYPFPRPQGVSKWFIQWWWVIFIGPALGALLAFVLECLGTSNQLRSGSIIVGSLVLAVTIILGMCGGGKRGKRWLARFLSLLAVASLECYYLIPHHLPQNGPAWEVGLRAWGFVLLTSSFAVAASSAVIWLMLFRLYFKNLYQITLGFPVEEIVNRSYTILSEKTDEEIGYIVGSAQPTLGSAEVRSLPWVLLIAILSVEAVTRFFEENLLGDWIVLAVIGLVIMLAIVAVCALTLHSYLQVAIIQAAERVRSERLVQSKAKSEQGDGHRLPRSRRGCLPSVFLRRDRRVSGKGE